jgi:hypothetical protein
MTVYGDLVMEAWYDSAAGGVRGCKECSGTGKRSMQSR